MSRSKVSAPHFPGTSFEVLTAHAINTRQGHSTVATKGTGSTGEENMLTLPMLWMLEGQLALLVWVAGVPE